MKSISTRSQGLPPSALSPWFNRHRRFEALGQQINFIGQDVPLVREIVAFTIRPSISHELVHAANLKYELMEELLKNRQALIELRDKHLDHAAAIVRALVQKRIEAADAIILRAQE